MGARVLTDQRWCFKAQARVWKGGVNLLPPVFRNSFKNPRQSTSISTPYRLPFGYRHLSGKIMSTLTTKTATGEASLQAGPFHPTADSQAERGELGRAVMTSLLALYPVLATVGVVLVTLAFTRAA